jgi:hypothetical protein
VTYFIAAVDGLAMQRFLSLSSSVVKLDVFYCGALCAIKRILPSFKMQWARTCKSMCVDISLLKFIPSF